MSFRYKQGDRVVFYPRPKSNHKEIPPDTIGVVCDSEQGNQVAVTFPLQGVVVVVVCQVWDLDLLERKTT